MGIVIITIEPDSRTSSELKEIVLKELTLGSKIMKVTGYSPKITICSKEIMK